MDTQKKNVLIGIAIFLWVLVILPCMVWISMLYNAYTNGSYFGNGFFDERKFYSGWTAVKMGLDDIIAWGGGLLWFYYLLFVLGYTIFLIIKIKKHKK